jgi:hypothetical protein
MAYHPASDLRYTTSNPNYIIDQQKECCTDSNNLQSGNFSKLEEYEKAIGLANQLWQEYISGLSGQSQPQAIKTTIVDTRPSACDILKDIAKRGIERPHVLPEAEIQILAAFVLRYNGGSCDRQK